MVLLTEEQWLLNRVVYWALGLGLGLSISVFVLMAKDVVKAFRLVYRGQAWSDDTGEGQK